MYFYVPFAALLAVCPVNALSAAKPFCNVPSIKLSQGEETRQHVSHTKRKIPCLQDHDSQSAKHVLENEDHKYISTETNILRSNEARTLWIESSLKYYATITRGQHEYRQAKMQDRRVTSTGQRMGVQTSVKDMQKDANYLRLAMENYFAWEKIKMGKAHHAETIYRRLMEEMMPSVVTDSSGTFSTTSTRRKEKETHACDFASLAVPTLLLALLLQRERRYEDARSVFAGFAYIYDATMNQKRTQKSGNGNSVDSRNTFLHSNHLKCSCSARVFQAYALFEMKQNNPQKAVQLIFRAVRLDSNLRPVLRWKQFRTALDNLYNTHHHYRHQQLQFQENHYQSNSPNVHP